MGNKNSPPSNNTPPTHTDTNNQPSSLLELAYKKWKKIINNYDTAYDTNHVYPSEKTFKTLIKATIDFSNGFVEYMIIWENSTITDRGNLPSPNDSIKTDME